MNIIRSKVIREESIIATLDGVENSTNSILIDSWLKDVSNGVLDTLTRKYSDHTRSVSWKKENSTITVYSFSEYIVNV